MAIDETVQWAQNVLEQAQARGFYGELTFHLEMGRVKRMTKKESILPPASQTARETKA